MKNIILKCIATFFCFTSLFTFTACNNGENTDTKLIIPNISIEEKNGSSKVNTGSGFAYTASGYQGIEDEAFVFQTGLELSFSADMFDKKFNRFTMQYSSTAPVHIYVTYKNHRGKKTVADFFLEKGEGDFSGLILDYIDKKTATEITKIVVDSCENKQGRFMLYNLSAEKAKCCVGLFGSTEYFIKNERFKLGVDMSWGGALCYISDRKCDIRGLDNLVNKADEGRLIQQSYYGTYEIPGVYEPGEFNNAKWNYNPVQGGDQYGNDSRIIDVVVTDNSIYVKTQPQDWSLDGAITPSYMENTFILHDDYIEAKNRFVDFSGWTHPVTTQELPAFYTVSYLDSFVYYDGLKPWSGDALTCRDNLSFWGDPLYHDSCTFPLRQSNTEAWCAWINSKNNYGLGVYAPNTDTFVAGRAAYDGSKDADAGSCSYVAPLKKLSIVSFEALEYSYLLATGSVEDIRATFTKNKNFALNEALDKNSVSMRVPDVNMDLSYIDFTNEEYCSLLSNNNGVHAVFDETEGALKATVTGSDPYAAIIFSTAESEFIAENYKTIDIVYKVPTANAYESYSIELFLSTGDTVTATAGNSVVESLIVDGEYQTLSVDVSSLGYWKGRINEIRFDFFNESIVGDVLYIKSVELK